MKNFFIGIIAGIICGMFSVGAGLVLIPTYVYILKMDEKKARATSIFSVLPMVIVTAIIYWKNNFIDWELGIKCAIGGIVGAIIGSKLLNNISTKILKILFIILLIYAGFKILLK